MTIKELINQLLEAKDLNEEIEVNVQSTKDECFLYVVPESIKLYGGRIYVKVNEE